MHVDLPPEAFVTLLKRPDLFTEDFLIAGRKDERGRPIKLHPEQAEIMSLASGRWPVVRAGRGVGKTALLAFIIYWWMFTRPTAKVAVISVKKEQLADAIWPELKRWLTGSAIEEFFEWQKTKIFFKDEEAVRFCVARTGSTAEALQGLHDPHLLIIIEEASGVEEEMFDALVGSLTQEYNAMVMVGNPTKSHGAFFDAFSSPVGRFQPFHIPCIDRKGNLHPNVQMDFVEMMAHKYGRDSNPYRVYVLGEPPKTDSDSVIPWEWVNIAAEQEDAPECKDYRIVWGVDPALMGDRCALVKRQGPVMRERPIFWEGKDTGQVAGRIVAEYQDTPDELRPDDIFVDTIGIGYGVVDNLRRAGMPVRAVNVSNTPALKEKHFRLRDELWWLAREWFETRAVWIPNPRDEHDVVTDMISELTTPRFEFRPDGKIQVESKRQFKSRLKERRSPDLADAFVLTFAAGMDRLTPQAREKKSRWLDRNRKGGGSWMVA